MSDKQRSKGWEAFGEIAAVLTVISVIVGIVINIFPPESKIVVDCSRSPYPLGFRKVLSPRLRPGQSRRSAWPGPPTPMPIVNE